MPDSYVCYVVTNYIAHTCAHVGTPNSHILIIDYLFFIILSLEKQIN